jgi:hypothetical protein
MVALCVLVWIVGAFLCICGRVSFIHQYSVSV